MAEKYVLALDQGTTSSRAILFDERGEAVATAARELSQHFPQPGWVEHDPLEIWESQLAVARRAVASAGVGFGRVAAVGITNQRETTVVWERDSGRPLHNAIVWQCRRTADLCDQLRKEGFHREISARTGLVADAYFSGSKLAWLLEHIPNGRRRAEAGEILFGTVDSWLLYNLTGGRVHATDPSNASRTMLYNIHEHGWDPVLLERLGIPEAVLPQVMPSDHDHGLSAEGVFPGARVPVAGMIGDQQAALFGQACFRPGQTKITYGTGSFLLMNTGESPMLDPDGGLLTSVAWDLEGRVTYCLEGSIFIAGAVIRWLRDQLGLLDSPEQSRELALSVPDNGGVYFVPAFAGLGAPHWDQRARGAILGLTLGSNKGHLVRAALESVAYQTRDILEVMSRVSGLALAELRADGGAAANSLMMQFVADILDTRVSRPAQFETTALGAAFLAGLKTGVWRDLDHLEQLKRGRTRFFPGMDVAERDRLYRGWQKAVARAAGWAEDGQGPAS